MRLPRWLVLTVLLAGVVWSGRAQQTPDVGQHAHPFQLPTPDGKMVSLAELEKHGPVVLVVLRGYPGYQCPFCEKQVHDYVENAAAFAGKGAAVLLVYPGPPAELDQHARDAMLKQNALPANVRLVVDPDYHFTMEYGLRWEAPHETAYPATFVLGRDGAVLYRKVSMEHGDRSTAAEVLAQVPATTVARKGK